MVKIIKDLCEANGTTLKALERNLSLGNGTIRRWDDSAPSVDKLVRVANYFGVSVNDLLKDSTPEQKNKPTPKNESGQGLPAGYDKLTPENKAIVDRLIHEIKVPNKKSPLPVLRRGLMLFLAYQVFIRFVQTCTCKTGSQTAKQYFRRQRPCV